jgi:3-deoxy-D-manno-octulosonic-acid transferase
MKSMRRFIFVNKIFNIFPFNVFHLVVTPSEEIKNFVVKLGAKSVVVMPNMKTMAKKLPISSKNTQKLNGKIGNRKIWMAASTHEGEEEIVIKTHKKLKKIYPDLLTVIAIRHPDRLDEVSKLCQSLDVSCTNHVSSFVNSDKIREEIYILNKIGCLGDFFEVIDTILVCGSLIPGIGGHNFLEPLRFNCSVATGKYIENFRDIYNYVHDCCKVTQSQDDIYFFVKDSLSKSAEIRHSAKCINFEKQWKDLIKKSLIF